MSDFQYTVGGDFNEILRQFDQLDQRAKQSGQAIGKGIDEGTQQAKRTFGDLVREIQSLKATKATLAVDSSEYKAAEARIKELGAAIAALNRERARSRGDAGVSELGAAAKKAAGDFDYLRVAVEGVALGIAGTLTQGALSSIAQIGRAITGLVGQFGQLDTELRKAAAADGGAGAYQKIAATVDRVGIEASGTTLEVAQLATELVRGGMTLDQVNASLGAIVRGAEATGTGFAEMGSNVGAALRIFGIPASDATRVVDALTQGANASAASVQGLGYAFAYAGPIAKQVGLSIEDLGTAVGLLSNAGIDASSAGVTLRNGLTKLAGAAPQAGGGMRELTGQAAIASKAMRALGVDIYESDGTLKPMETTLLRLKAAFERLAPAAKIRLASDMFGGEDDGSRWLALLGQSEEEIRRMSAAMSNTKGATDRARDAMQGFELKVKQLDGTLGSLQNTAGGVVAAALIPLVDLANTAAGAVTALPAPVKETAVALGLMVGGLAAARVGLIVFQRALAVTQVQQAIGGITALAGAVRVRLAADLVFAAGAFRQFTAAAATASAVSVGTAGSAAWASIAAGATAATNAVKGLTAAVAAGGLASGIKALAAGGAATLAGWAPLLPLAGLLGLVAANVAVWNQATEKARQISNDFAGSQEEVDAALRKLNTTLGRTAVQAGDTRNALQLLIARANNARALDQLSSDSNRLQDSLTRVQVPAIGLLRILQQSGGATAQQRREAAAYADTLDTLAEAARKRAEALRASAGKEDLKGDPEVAINLRARAAALDAEARASTAAANALRDKTGATKANTAATNADTRAVEDATRAEQRRQAIASTKRTVGETEITQLEAAFVLTKDQADERRRILELQTLQAEKEAQIAKLRDGDTNKPNFDVETRQKIAEIDSKIADNALRGARARVDLAQREFALAQGRLELSRQAIDLENQAGQITLNKFRDAIDVATAQLSLQQALTSLSRSQYDVDLARQDFSIKGAEEELQLMRDRGASADQVSRQEQFITSLRRGRENIEQRKLAAEIAGAEQRFALEREMLRLKQAQQVIEAQSAISAARQNTIQQEIRLLELKSKAADPSLNAAQRNALQEGIALQQKAVGLSYDQEGAARNRLQVLGTIFGLENRALAAQQQTAANGYRAEAAARGWEGALQGPLDNLDSAALATQTLVGQFQEVVTGFIQAAGQTVLIRDTVYEIVQASTDASAAANSLAAGYSDANTQAQALLATLQDISTTPQARWAGGPVDPSVAYRVNELGQESLLTPGGALSLINAPARGMWRPPTRGTVLPAGVTATLKARGAFGAPPMAAGRAGGGDAFGNLKVAIEELRAEMQALRQKNWGVQVRIPGNAGILGAIGGL